jgi:hypothetical protein
MSQASTEDTLRPDELSRSTNSTSSDVDGHFSRAPSRDFLLPLESKCSGSVPFAVSSPFSVSRARLEKRHPSQDGASLKSSLSTSTRVTASSSPGSRIVRDNPQHSKVYSGDYTPGVKYPPRPPKAGNEWVWFPEGYRAERNIVEPFRSRGRPKHPVLWGRIFRTDIYIYSSPTTALGTVESTPEEASHMLEIRIAEEQDYGNAHVIPALSESDNISIKNAQNSKQKLRGLPCISTTYPQFQSPSGKLEGLNCKAKRGIEEGLIKKREKARYRCLKFRINYLYFLDNPYWILLCKVPSIYHHKRQRLFKVPRAL